MFFHPLALGRIRQHGDQEGGLAARVTAERYRQMSPEFGTVFAAVAFFDLEKAALAPHQLAQRSLVGVGSKIDGIKFRANSRMRFAMKLGMKSGKELSIARAGQFRGAVAEHSAECGIRFQNPAIEVANGDSDRGPFKHRLETQ